MKRSKQNMKLQEVCGLGIAHRLQASRPFSSLIKAEVGIYFYSVKRDLCFWGFAAFSRGVTKVFCSCGFPRVPHWLKLPHGDSKEAIHGCIYGWVLLTDFSKAIACHPTNMTLDKPLPNVCYMIKYISFIFLHRTLLWQKIKTPALVLRRKFHQQSFQL